MTGLGLGGCIVDDGIEDSNEEPGLGEVAQAIGGTCPAIICGENGPELSGVGFFDLQEGGDPNLQGFRLDGIYFGTVRWDVDVVRDQLIARKGIYSKQGVHVLGGVMKVKSSEGVVYDLLIENVAKTPMYPVSVASGKTWAYTITWKLETAPKTDIGVPLCSKPDELMGEQDTLFQDPYSVVLFEGQRYNAEKITIDSSAPTAKWFNIGCAGNMLAKLHLTHHGPFSGAIPGFITTDAERIAMMKMLAADYCGIGKAFTYAHHPLSWTDDHGWLPHIYSPSFLKFEARFTQDGVSCLETPRLEGTTDPDAIAMFGTDMWTAIGNACGDRRPKRCSDIGESLDFNVAGSQHLVSATPHFP